MPYHPRFLTLLPSVSYLLSESIKKVPEQFQEAFNSQQYLQAATILVDAVDKLYQDDLLRIGALVELQAEIVAKKNTFHEVALELLHNLIYLKDAPDLGEEFSDIGGSSTSMQSSNAAASGAAVPSNANAGSASGGASSSATGGKASSATGNASSAPNNEVDMRTKALGEKDSLTIKLELMEQLVSAFFVLGKSSQAINKILERLRSELRHIIQKAVATVKKRHESNPVLLQQILSRPNRGPHAHDYPNLFLDMLQIVFSKAKEVLIFHRCVTEFFDNKMREQQQMEEDATRRTEEEDAGHRRGARANGGARGRASSQTSGSASTANTGTLGADGARSSMDLGRDSLDSVTPNGSTTSTYRLDHVWEEFQKELQALIGYFIAAPSETTILATGANTKKHSMDVAHQGARLFSFSNSSAFTLYEVSETQSFTYRNMDLGDPSPYNLPSLYPLISNFCELGSQIVMGSMRNPTQRLQEWMDDFIAVTLLSVVKMDYKSRIEGALQSGEAFKSRDSKLVKSAYSTDEGRRPLLNSAVEVFQCIKELYEDSVAMPIYTAHIHGIMDTCLMTYYDACKAKYDEYIRDSEVGKTVKNSEFQKLVLTDPQWRRILRQFKLGGAVSTNTATLAGSIDSASSDSGPGSGKISDNNGDLPIRPVSTISAATSLIRGGSSVSDGHGSAGLVDAEETEYTTNLMDFESAWHTGTTNAGVPISGRHMIMDPSRLVNLAALHDSTYWIADRVAFLERMEIIVSPSSLPSGSIIGGALGMSSLTPGNASANTATTKAARDSGMKPTPGSSFTASTPSGSRRMQRRDSKEQFQASSTVFRPKLSSSLTNLTWMFKDLSDQCLHNIYVDFRLQTCYYLDGLNKNYVYAAEDRMPDQRIVDLNTSLANAYMQLQAYLPAAKLRYLLGGLPTLMSALLVESLKSHIESINRNGVVKMVRNIFTLQQNLTGMTTFNEVPFDKARRYYELLNLNLEEVYAFITQHHHAEDQGSYTLNQYRTVLEVIANPKSRTLTDEQEKDLRDKFVLVPYPADSFKRPVK